MIERQILKLAVAMAMMYGLASASVVGYHVEPVKASWSGHTDTIPPNNYVEQTVVACWDSLERVELFAGARGNGGAYAVQVLVDGDPVMTSPGNAVPEHGWVKFDQWTDTVAFTKGKTVTIRFTRGGNDSIQYYYDHTDPYKYGEMPNDILPNGADLCARVYARLNVVDSTTDWGVTATMPRSGDPAQSAWGRKMHEAGMGWGLLDVRWNEIETLSGSYDFTKVLPTLVQLACSARAEPVVCLPNCAWWASSRLDTSYPINDTAYVWNMQCAPRNLWKPDTGDTTNYWKRYLTGFRGT